MIIGSVDKTAETQANSEVIHISLFFLFSIVSVLEITAETLTCYLNCYNYIITFLFFWQIKKQPLFPGCFCLFFPFE